MKTTPAQFQAARSSARLQGITEGSMWQHYKGGVYVVDGFCIDTHDGLFKVLYSRVGGPNFSAKAEAGMSYSRVPEEWNEKVEDRRPRFLRLKD